VPLEPAGRGGELGGLRRDYHEVGLRQRLGVGCRREPGREVGAAGDPQPFLVQRARVLLAATEDGDVRHAAEVAREEAADHPGADYADALDTVLRRASSPRSDSSRGSSAHSEPGSSASEKISRS
jgi:hypothetical protein